ncbi:MAG: copper homeostasis protein CutC [Erysipelotrichaceae bacterium]
MKKIVEICCGSYLDALNAHKGNADRIELNSALHLGGLTPSVGTLQLVKNNTNLKTIVMVRPRGAGFNYNDEDFITMKLDTKIMLENGADGIAFGILDEVGNIDIERTKEIIDIIKTYQKEVVFHRAFDCVNDPHQAIQQLIDLKVDRVLTSGLQNKAIEGIDLLTELQAKYGAKIEILIGSGINHTNALEIMNKTNINQIHSSCKSWIVDETTTKNSVSYAYGGKEKTNYYDIVSSDLVIKLVKTVK